MKRHLTNNTLHLVAGSEMFMYDLAMALKKLGHTVHIIPYDDNFDTTKHPIPMKLERAGIRCLSAIEDIHKDYDIVHCQHNNITSTVSYWLPDTPKIFVSHGVVFQICEPNLDIKFKKIVCVSAEIKAKLKGKNYKNLTIINNVINTDRFKFKKKPYKKIKNICMASNHVGKPCKKAGLDCEAYEKYKNPYFLDYCYHDCDIKPFHNMVKIAKELESNIFFVGGFSFINDDGKVDSKNKSIWNVEDAYNNADIVVGIGRSALSAMSFGVPTLIYDHFGYVGFIKTEKQFYEVMKTNFSGRPWGGVVNDFPILNSKEFLAEYEEQRENLKMLSDLVKKEYGSEIIAKKYEALYEKSITK